MEYGEEFDEPDFWLHLTGALLKGRYRVVSMLGKGGSSLTYLAMDERDGGAKVVVKIPHVQMLILTGFRECFEVEVETLLDLSHPHIAKILDLGSFQSTPFAVAEYCSGGTLLQQFAAGDGGLQPAEVTEWLPVVASTLDFLHQRGFIHRDIKPENLLFDHSGRIMLSDLAMSKALRGVEARHGRVDSLVGSPPYMAPEALRAMAPDAAYDQYSLAVVVYQSLTGRLPLDWDMPLAYLSKKLGEPAADLALVAPGVVPRAATQAVMRALSISPRLRFKSCSDFARTFVDGVGTHRFVAIPRPSETEPPAVLAAVPSPSPVRQARPRSRRLRDIAAVAAAAAILVAGAIGSMLTGLAARPQPSELTAEARPQPSELTAEARPQPSELTAEAVAPESGVRESGATAASNASHEALLAVASAPGLPEHRVNRDPAAPKPALTPSREKRRSPQDSSAENSGRPAPDRSSPSKPMAGAAPTSSTTARARSMSEATTADSPARGASAEARSGASRDRDLDRRPVTGTESSASSTNAALAGSTRGAATDPTAGRYATKSELASAHVAPAATGASPTARMPANPSVPRNTEPSAAGGLSTVTLPAASTSPSGDVARPDKRWQPLLTGELLPGWKTVGHIGWSLQDQILQLNKATVLVTERQHKNLAFTLRARAQDGEADFGMVTRAQGGGRGIKLEFHRGKGQLQIGDTSIPLMAELEPGAWHQLDLIVSNGTVLAYLDRKKLTSATDAAPVSGRLGVYCKAGRVEMRSMYVQPMD